MALEDVEIGVANMMKENSFGIRRHGRIRTEPSRVKYCPSGSFLTDRPTEDPVSVIPFPDPTQPFDFDFDWCQHLLDSPETDFLQPYLLDMFGFSKTSRGYFALIIEEGKINRMRGAETWEYFFREETEGKKFVVVTKERFRMIADQQVAYQAATQMTDSFVIISCRFQLRKLRQVPWSRELTQREEQIKDLPALPVSRDTLFQHDLCTYHYAGQLKKSSFSPYLPYASILTQRLKKSKSAIISLPPDEQQLIKFAQIVMRRRAASLDSMILVVGEDAHSCCYLLGISNVCWCDLKSMTLPMVKSIKPICVEPLITDTCSARNARSKIGKNLGEFMLKTVTKAPYIDTNEIQMQNIKMYERIVASKPVSSDSLVSDPFICPIVHSLNTIAEKFDMQKQQLEAYKTQISAKSSFKTERFRELVHKAYLKLTKDEVMQRFFQSNEELHLQHLSDQFQQALTTPKNYYLSRRIRRVHQHFGITLEVFQRFTKAFRDVSRESGISESEEEIMLANMLWYQSDIVTVFK